jgi:hypothetical protein
MRISRSSSRIVFFAAATAAFTTMLGLPPAEAAVCGAQNQRPCKVWERVPSCNRGLVEDLRRNRCVARAAPAPRPQVCGGFNQRPCLVTERIPSCNPGLVEDLGARRCVARRALSCGGLDQRPCLVVERIPSCDRGLAENFLSNRCVAAGPGHLRRQADAALRDLAPLLRGALAVRYCQSLQAQRDRLEQLLKTRNAAQLADWPRRDPCLRRIRDAALSGGYQTFTLGIGGGIQLGFGVNSEVGVAFDVHLRNPPRIYATIGYVSGFGASVGNNFAISFYKAPNARIGGDAQGFVYSGKALAGGGAAIWYDYQGRLAGASAFASIGAGGEVGVYNRVRTQVY